MLLKNIEDFLYWQHVTQPYNSFWYLLFHKLFNFHCYTVTLYFFILIIISGKIYSRRKKKWPVFGSALLLNPLR